MKLSPSPEKKPGTSSSRRSLSQRLWRRRSRQGEACASVPYDSGVVEFLLRYRWLAPEAVDDKAEIGSAIGRLVRDTAKAARE